MKIVKKIGSMLCALGFVGAAQAENITVIHAGQLLDEPGKPPKEAHSIIIRDGLIDQVLPTASFSEQSLGVADGDILEIHNLEDKFVLPGLIDGHVHLTSELNPQGRLQTVQMSDADRAMMGALHAKRTLMAGFTTVRDVGAGTGDAIFALRDATANGWVSGPRIFASGATISVTGGHGDGTQGYRDDIAHMFKASGNSGTCDGVESCRRAVREQVRRGADHIKLTATGGVLSNTAAGTEVQFFEDELKAIMDTAHSMGRKVTAHAHGKNGIDAALEAGVDSIEHGTYLDPESVRLFRRSGAYLVPTLLAGQTVVEIAESPNSFLTPPQRKKSLQVGPQMIEMARTAHDGGVKIAFGTDSGVSRHGDNAREFELLVKAGMTPAEAVYSATVAGADNLGMSDSLGTLRPGKLGDLIAVDGNPLQDISVLLDVEFVMKEGVLYKE
ncbi:amidohydrolase family protein [Parvularcula sp. IMCC14364]|uniref:metal-dependent hydrolase family protein n=1 Tax=Parvularcula sp. IMCC14364 TaxID=3067902 RepID=UPI00274036EB|nr:amidohydrolase family protein [Parvularcula sp. IMCC14364]